MVLAVNDLRKRSMAGSVAKALGGQLRGKIIGVLGLTFKPETDDMREAPSLSLIAGLRDMGAVVEVYDAVGMENARRELQDVEYCEDAYARGKGAHGLVL
jgi:UDPglucose 6-dehydrogenase